MKRVTITLILFGFAVSFLNSCKKDYSCDNCLPNSPNSNQPPVSKAGTDQVITLPKDSVLLDGSASSDTDGSITTYQWSKISGPVSFNIVTPTSAATKVKTLTPGTYQFELKVTDNGGLFARDTVSIVVDAVFTSNHPPVAVAGADQTTTLPNNTVTLNGNSSTDPDNNIASYSWTNVSGPASLFIVSGNQVQTQVTSLVQGVYEFELKVTDSGGLFSKDTLTITVNNGGPVNHAPVAKAGMDQTIILPSNTVALDGSNSTDPDNNITAYQWTKILGPSTFAIANANAVQTQVNNLVQGTYEFELKVTDAGGLWSKDTVQVDVVSSAVFVPCDGSTRQLVPAQLIPVGSLGVGRQAMAATKAGNKVVFAGGNTGGTSCSQAVDILDIVSNTWTTAQLSNPTCNIKTAVSGNKIFFAGASVNGSVSPVIDIYDAVTNSWTTMSLPVLSSRAWIDAGVSAGNKVILVTGNFFAGPPPLYTRYTFAEIFDVATNTWHTDTLHNRTHSFPNDAISDAGIAATVIGNKIYLAGNASDWYAWDFGTISPTINVYDVATNMWTTAANLNLARGFTASISTGNKNIWAGGLFKQPNEPFTQTVEIRDMMTGNSTYGCLFQPNAFFSAVQKGNQIAFFTSGEQVPAYFAVPPVYNRFDIYNTATNTWSIGVLPVNMKGSAIISVNNNVYVAGGYVNGVLTNQVWKLVF